MLLNHASKDPFADTGDDFVDNPQAEDLKSTDPKSGYVHIRIQQRNGRKTLTTVQGVPSEYDPKKILKYFKKEFACNGTLVEDATLGRVIQLQGDQRTKVLQFLTSPDMGIPKSGIKIHGF
ncbi:translation initiation factor SU [Atractiella rhizophila]|nr:translation initiation factor SU [Atractiella rhizophila]